MIAIIGWLFTTFLVWLGISAVMFVFSMGTFSSIGPHKKSYWKWSILLSIYATIPIVGWIVGFMHVSYAWNKMGKEVEKNRQVQQMKMQEQIKEFEEKEQEKNKE